MSRAAGDEPASTALEAGTGNGIVGAGTYGADALAQPGTQLVQGGVDRDLVLHESSEQQVGMHEPYRSPGEPAGPPQKREADVDGAQGICGVGLGATDAQQAQLGPAVAVLERQAGGAHESNPELGDGCLPLVRVLAVHGADGPIAEQLEVPPGSGVVDTSLLGYEVGQRREGDGRRRPQLDVRDARVVQELICDAPLGGCGAVPAAIVVLERDSPGAKLLHASEKRDGDLRELLVYVGADHGPRVRGYGRASAEQHVLNEADR
jgi:hypothetical protein